MNDAIDAMKVSTPAPNKRGAEQRQDDGAERARGRRAERARRGHEVPIDAGERGRREEEEVHEEGQGVNDEHGVQPRNS